MALTSSEINRIHTQKLATTNQKYYADDGKIYIGTTDNRLRLLDKAKNTTFSQIQELRETNVQDAIESLVDTLETDVVRSIAADEEEKITGDVVLKSGDNTELIQTDNEIEINFNKPADIIYDDTEIVEDIQTTEEKLEDLTELFRRLLIELTNQGFEFQDERLLEELEIAYKEINEI